TDSSQPTSPLPAMKFITFSAVAVAVFALVSSVEAATPCYNSCMKQNGDANYCDKSCYDSSCYSYCVRMGGAASSCRF
ncbi:hypothetical protein BGZ52_013348, partial [Haplosporangium bisporale]